MNVGAISRVPWMAVPRRLAAGGPVDSVGSSVPSPDLVNGADMARLVLGAGPATSLGRFFGEDADRVQAVERLPGGGLKLVFEYPPSICRGKMERVLAAGAPEGWSTAWGQSYRAPFGVWTRRDGAWEAACALPSADPRSRIEDSMLMLRVEDGGGASMVLWERLRGGGGVLYELDAEAWLRAPGGAPRVREMRPYAGVLEAAVQDGPPAWEQFFGPAAPSVAVKRREPNDSVPEGGAGVDLKFEWGGIREVHIPLLKRSAPGFVHASYRMEDQLFQRWERTQDGWTGETRARPLPEHFDRWARVALRTEMDAEGTLRAMTLRAEGRGGDVAEYVLDGADYLAGRARVPTVREVRRTAGPPRVEVPAEAPPGPVVDAGGWIVVDGVRVPKRG